MSRTMSGMSLRAARKLAGKVLIDSDGLHESDTARIYQLPV